MIVFMVIIFIGVGATYFFVKSVDRKHTENHIALKGQVEKNQMAIKKTAKEILGYDPFDISTKGGKT